MGAKEASLLLKELLQGRGDGSAAKDAGGFWKEPVFGP